MDAAARRVAAVRRARIAVIAVRLRSRCAAAGVAHVAAAGAERAAIEVRAARDAFRGRSRRAGAKRATAGGAARSGLAVARAGVAQLPGIRPAVAARRLAAGRAVRPDLTVRQPFVALLVALG